MSAAGGRPPPAPVVAYGAHPDQIANLHVPPGDGPFPVVVLVHGGFWRSRWDRTLMTPLARDLAARGLAAWNVEYRRVGQEGGGWPGTFLDVAAAIDHLAGVAEADPSRVVACGHSAGGQLALWLAGRHLLSASAPGASPKVRPRAAVALAGVANLAGAHASDLGDGAVAALLGGGPREAAQRYASTDPMQLAPLGVPQIIVHGERDDTVPPAQSRAYAEAAGAEAALVEVPEADHFDVIDPAHASWRIVVEQLPELLGS